MSEELIGIVASTVKSQEDAMALMEKLFDVAQPGAVYGEPIAVEDHTVITASEVKVGMGFGFGAGGGPNVETAEGEGKPEGEEIETGFGSGGGGGGVSGGRPVAAIVVGPDGVRVDPIVDVTKVALAFFTTMGAMFMMFNRMRAASRRLSGQ
jgi:uncharacterized spore protein YtfJ